METEYIQNLLAEIPMETLTHYQKEYLHRLADSVTAAVMSGTPYSPPSATGHSDDTTSSVFPERPIRPLPKRPLRSRLSPEAADTISFPPVPVTNDFHEYPRIFNRSNSIGQAGQQVAEIDRALIAAQKAYKGQHPSSYQFKGTEDADSEDEEEEQEEEGHGLRRRYFEEQYPHEMALANPPRPPPNGNMRGQEGQSLSTNSSNESIDGYDSFENTNNKKKRKIPTSTTFGSLHNTLSAELASMGISYSREKEMDTGADLGNGSSHLTPTSSIPIPVVGTGISGAGRGRYGRSGRRDVSGRSPLGISMNGSNSSQLGFAYGREFTPQHGESGKASAPLGDHGIISAAIAEATALPMSPDQGQENVSLLDQETSKKSTPAKTQFTFTYESESSKGVIWPGENTSLPGPSYPDAVSAAALNAHRAQKDFNNQGTQTSPTMVGPPSSNRPTPSVQQQAQQQAPRKPRRPPGKQYAMAARERRLQQEDNNYHHPPKDEDIWICEFCEYESIFGSPPEALVRQYEIKDRRQRKTIANKRRLLEKAKLKGRKAKKGSKNASKTGTASAYPAPQSGPLDHSQLPSQNSHHSQGTQSDDYYDEMADYDSAAVPAPSIPMLTKIPQPTAQNYSQSIRYAHSSALNTRDGRSIRA